MSQRIHFSPNLIDAVVPHSEYRRAFQPLDYKPNGFWFSVQASEPEWSGWLEWCRAEDFHDMEAQYPHVLDLDESQILMIGPGDLGWFNETFGKSKYPDSQYPTMAIDWKLVAQQFAGIEISPYSWRHRHHRAFSWYYGWDCASGCIWDVTAIKSIEPIALSEVETCHPDSPK